MMEMWINEGPWSGVIVHCTSLLPNKLNGATSFLYTEYQYVTIFMVTFAVLIFLFLGSVEGFSTSSQECTYYKTLRCKPALFTAIFSTVAFILGAVTSLASGFLGMKIATYSIHSVFIPNSVMHGDLV